MRLGAWVPAVAALVPPTCSVAGVGGMGACCGGLGAPNLGVRLSRLGRCATGGGRWVWLRPDHSGVGSSVTRLILVQSLGVRVLPHEQLPRSGPCPTGPPLHARPTSPET